MARYKKNKKHEPGILFRGVRMLVSIVVLTAFVLGISYFVKEVSSLDARTLTQTLAPYLELAGIDSEQFGKAVSKIVSKFPAGNTLTTGVNGSGGVLEQDYSSTGSVAGSSVENLTADESESVVLASIVLLADSHDKTELLKKSLEMAKEIKPDYVFHLGDLTDLGLLETLREAKGVLDSSGLKYYAISGDHDLWKSVGPENFLNVFNKNYHSVTVGDNKFVLFDNSANYSTVSDVQMSWFENELTDADFVVLSQPLYHPVNDRVMGVVNGEEVMKVKEQAGKILDMIRNSGVEAIIAADHHQYSEYEDPVNSNLTHYVVGAITDTRNIQTPRFAVLKIYENRDFTVEEVMLE
ncbi:MAG: Metallophosphoesterase [candidate division WWE3 bacterium GW2011_GWC1_41_7]|uniref:Metallophosphoesterase n=3 Tax=Katanobacteria TaxID=422282 RepID=A0A0G1A9B8_UNCKA|nr:MAG: Metallophosphoesterase [candidate division WWE3 bacterium GW2011_GWB1_41_6]KKS20766.1 MAG: Metallophosphoesterase [candidate division WWE3 bacterium GW2011_GWC1_41_7]KKS21928.1 MAG: Metallophosphoesterase [candidate division WWE3 bacterium GW2011_GWA1_41_8]